MYLAPWFQMGVAATIALAASCSGASRTSTGAAAPAATELPPVTIESTTSASQVEMAAGFPDGKFKARCASLGGDTTYDRLMKVDRVDAKWISYYEDDDPERIDTVYRSTHYDDMVELDRSPLDDYTRVAMMLDDAIVFAHRTGAGFTGTSVCTVTGDLERMRRRSGREFGAELAAYQARRFEAKQIADAGAAAVREVERDADRAERLARLESLVSLRVSASASDRDDDPEVSVVATLADGSTMKVVWGDPVFTNAFAVNVVRGDTAMMVEVTSRDDDDIRDEREVPYSFDRERTFACRGEPGKSGMEYDSARGMYYHGRRGDHGPTITVAITTTGKTTARGQQILHYRLSCDDRDESFLTSAGTKVHVATYGGDGGYGVELANGDGGNGGNGGNGGDVDVTVDPSVKRYHLTTLSRGGRGGAPSSAKGKTNVNAYGTRGDDGAEGTVSETRAPVALP